MKVVKHVIKLAWPNQYSPSTTFCYENIRYAKIDFPKMNIDIFRHLDLFSLDLRGWNRG